MRAEPKTSSQVLYFIQEIKKEKQVLDLCRDMGIMIRKLKEEDAGRSVGVLADSLTKSKIWYIWCG